MALKQQVPKKSDEDAKYGIAPYNLRQLEFHKDVMMLLNSEKHREIPADECLVVFARCYSIYVVSLLHKEGKLSWNKGESHGNQ